jgi:peptidoglycan/xylan/chitin deacetylase (PgdA/CDA1 family)
MTTCLMYHDLVDGSDPDDVGMPGPVAARYKHAPKQFADHLDAVSRTGRSVGLLAPDEPWPEVAFTFDDGGSSAPLIATMLEARGWRGHFLITTGRIGATGFVSADEIRALVARGHSVGSHSHSHPRYMGRLTREQLDAEWRQSAAVLEGITGQRPQTAGLPGGFLSGAVIESASAAGYRILFTSEPSSHLGRVGELVHIGRFTIWNTTPAQTAAAYAQGARGARGRLWAEWKLKQTSKRALPGVYRAGQSLRAARS